MWYASGMEGSRLKADIGDMSYDVALEVVARENERRMAYDPDKLHKVDCQALFGMTPTQLAKHYKISDVMMFQILNGKSALRNDIRHDMAIISNLMESTIYQIFDIQRIEYLRSIGWYCKAPGIPPYLQKYFKPWVKRAPPNVTEKSLARDERRRGKNLTAEAAANSDDKWIQHRMHRKKKRDKAEVKRNALNRKY